MARRRFAPINSPMTEAAKAEDVTITGDWTFTGTLDVSGATFSGLSSDDLSDVASIAMLDEAETVTGQWSFNSRVDLDGAALRIYDSGETDYAEFSHDGADFNLGFTNTADVNFSGITGSYTFDDQLVIQGNVQVQNGGDVNVGSFVNDGTLGLRMNSNANLELKVDSTTGGWARGWNIDWISGGRGGGMGALGSGESLTNFAIGTDSTWYGSDAIVKFYPGLSDPAIQFTQGQHMEMDGGNARVSGSYEGAVADDATVTFSAPDGSVAHFIMVNCGNELQYAFLFSRGSSIADLGSGTSVSVGTSGTNPDVDGNINIWKSASGTVSIKNRRGGNRNFTVYMFAA